MANESPKPSPKTAAGMSDVATLRRRARALLAGHPGAGQTSVYLELHSLFPWDKQREIDAKVAEMKPQGWTYLQSSEASLSRTSRSWGGGLTLHFIRTGV